MILDLPGFDKNTNQITFDLIHYLLMKKKNKKPITISRSGFLYREAPNHKKKQPVVSCNVVSYKWVLTV